jgi:predicted nuclease of restriction endonuclease-like (RecB) superfamily
MKFEHLIQAMTKAHQALQHQVRKTVDTSLILRNWLFGYYLVEFEQSGEDRAEYGERLVEESVKSLKRNGLKGLSATNLRLCRQLYLHYPQIQQTLSVELKQVLIARKSDKTEHLIAFPPVMKLAIEGLPITELLKQLTYSHFIELVRIDEPQKRLFYEIECIKGNWSVRELKRQIGSLLYERTGLSKDKAQLIQLTQNQAQTLRSEDIIRSPYIFEFLDLPEQGLYQEQDLEKALITHLEKFLLELGRGFCFEARQKRITVDNEHYYVDLVFYHRLLKCHVLIELKNRKFHHQDAGQLNFYLNYYRKHEMSPDDNPPVGILLCTAQDQEHVEFATAGLDNQLFVSQYQVRLPSTEELRQFLIQERESLLQSSSQETNT